MISFLPYSIIKDSRSEDGRVDLIARAEDVSKISRIFEQLGYGLPELSSFDDEKNSLGAPTTEETLKNAQTRTLSNEKSNERGNGYKQNAAAISMTSKEKPSVRKMLDDFKATLAKQREEKIRQKQHDDRSR